MTEPEWLNNVEYKPARRYDVMKAALKRIVETSTDEYAKTIAQSALPQQRTPAIRYCAQCGVKIDPTRKLCSQDCINKFVHGHSAARTTSIVEMRRGGWTYTRIAAKLGISMTRVRQIYRREAKEMMLETIRKTPEVSLNRLSQQYRMTFADAEQLYKYAVARRWVKA